MNPSIWIIKHPAGPGIGQQIPDQIVRLES